jgi:hypothetical protein
MNRNILAALMISLFALNLFAADAANWVEPMRKVHASFKGKPGTIAQYGDSITITMAFFVPLSDNIQNLPTDLEGAHKAMKKYVRPECWRGWKGPDNGNEGGTTSDWGLKGIDGWLKKQNPELALIMWGTNDSKHGAAGTAYKTQMAQIVDKVIANGTIPILYTIPPRGDQAGNAEVTKRMEEYVKAVREIAAEKNVPLIDFYKEIMDRQPENFHKTLLGDQLHPSYPDGHQNKFDEESLKLSGYTLRNYLTLKMFGQIFGQILEKH